jgi:hypothetical protein
VNRTDLVARFGTALQRVKAGEHRQREFEKQKAAEIEAAKERDRQAYRERGWPSG